MVEGQQLVVQKEEAKEEKSVPHGRTYCFH
jgi:hypothetical protein